MDLGSALLFLALLVLVALFVARPLLEPDRADADSNEELAALIAERERVLEALAELDADWELHKVPEEIYRGQRQQLVAEGTQVLKKIEETEPQSDRKPSSAKEISDAKLEALIASRKGRLKKARK